MESFFVLSNSKFKKMIYILIHEIPENVEKCKYAARKISYVSYFTAISKTEKT